MNSIIKNLGGDQSNANLTFYWRAEFKDGIIINQFDNNGLEHRYQEVKDKFSELTWFYLYNKNSSQNIFIVDVINGFIYINKIIQDFKENITIKNNIRLIYFRIRRNTVTLKDLKVKEQTHYNIGFQYNDTEGKNRQIILQIDELGNLILGD